MSIAVKDMTSALKWWQSLSPDEVLKHRKKMGQLDFVRITKYWIELGRP